jgi:hypothetical protein
MVTSAATRAGLGGSVNGPLRTYQGASVIAALAGIATLIGLAATSRADLGLLICMGLGLGAANTALTHISALRYLRGGTPDRGRFMRGLLLRFTAIAVIAVAFAVIAWQSGLGVLGGLVAFHLVLFAVAAVRRNLAARPAAADRQPA